MKKLVLLLASAIICAGSAFADTQSDFNTQISAYNRQIAAGQYQAAASSVARASAACNSVKNFQGSINLISGMEQILQRKSIAPDSLPAVYYTLAKAKFDTYESAGNSNQAQQALRNMIIYGEKTGSKEIATQMLFAAAEYYYGIGQTSKGDQCIARLIKQYDSSSDYKAADTAYQSIIKKAVSTNDTKLVAHTFESYMRWSDSIDALNADTMLGQVKQEYAESQQTIAEKDKTIRGKSSVIALFIVLFLCSLAALGVGVLFYLRIVKKNRRMKQSVQAANEQSAAKSAILHNMSSKMEPTLEKLDQNDPAVQNLRGYVKRVGELSDVGDTTPRDPESLEDVRLEPLCKELADEVRPSLAEGVKLSVDVPNVSAKIDGEEVRKILLHLLRNAAKYTPADGRITLSYRKRGAKVHQFVVSDTGKGIPAEDRETIFKAFNSSRDISEGDGLGLPICALRAEKMNGSLELDPDHARGASFILTLRQ